MPSTLSTQYPVLAAFLRTAPRAHVLAKNLRVEGLLKYSYVENRTKDGPYHNSTHGQDVARLVFALSSMAKHSFLTTKALFVAGLFHDFNHSLGLLTDEQNIEIAQNGLLDALSIYQSELPSRLERFVALEAIAATKYPYGSETYSFKEQSSLIRDADRLQILTLNWRSQLIGLGVEMEVSKEELITRSLSFHENLLRTLESPPARALIPELKALIQNRHRNLAQRL